MNQELNKAILSLIPEFTIEKFKFEEQKYTFSGNTDTEEGKKKKEKTCLRVLKEELIKSDEEKFSHLIKLIEESE